MDLSSESISAFMARWGRLGGLARTERKRAASRHNLAAYRQRAAVLPMQGASVAPLPVLFFPMRDNHADA